MARLHDLRFTRKQKAGTASRHRTDVPYSGAGRRARHRRAGVPARAYQFLLPDGGVNSFEIETKTFAFHPDPIYLKPVRKRLTIGVILIVVALAALASGFFPFGPCIGWTLFPLALRLVGIVIAAGCGITAGAQKIYRQAIRS